MNGFFIFLYICLQLLIGVYLSRRIKSESDYFLGGRRVPMFMAAFSLFATWFGAETCIGSSGQVYEAGLSGSRADPFGYGVCLFLMGLVVAGRIRKGNYVTLADYFKDRFGPGVELFAALALVPSSLFWGGAQLRAFGQVISATTALHVNLTIVLAAAFVILYTYLGGLLGDIYTDLIQGVVLVAGLVLITVFVLAMPASAGSLAAALTPERLSFLSPGEGLMQRLDRWMVPILGSLVAQEALSRILAARSTSTARRASFLACGVYLLVGSLPVALGLAGPVLMPGLADKEQFLVLLSERYLPKAAFVLFAGALVSAILSTIDSILLAVSALISHNFVYPVFKVRREKDKVLIARGVVGAAGAVSCCIALFGGGIYDLVISASSFGTAGVLVLTLGGFYLKKGGKMTALATLTAGLVVLPLADSVFHVGAPFLFTVGVSALVFVFFALRDL
jgi:Na+/proline symporter